MKGAVWPISITYTTKMLRLLASMAMEAVQSQLRLQEAGGDDLVLHLGCGHGDVTARELLPRLPTAVRLVAADKDYDAVCHAAAALEAPRLCFLELDIGTRCIRDTGVWRLGPYWKVFSFDTLQWVRHQGRAIRNISELLCRGGEAVLVFISRTGLFAIFETLSKSPRWSSYLKDYKQFIAPYQFSEHPKDEFNTYLEEAGFTVMACNETEMVYVADDELEVRETMAALNPFLPTIPEEEREAFLLDCEREAFRNRSLSTNRAPGGRDHYLFTYWAILAHAVKN